MSKVIKNPGVLWYTGVLTLDKGGTAATTPSGALNALDGVSAGTLDHIASATGLINGKVKTDLLPGDIGQSVSLHGQLALRLSEQRTYEITNYDSFSSYELSSDVGIISALTKSGVDVGKFTYTAPTVMPDDKLGRITINGTEFSIDLLETTVVLPSIQTPTEGWSGEWIALTSVVGSPFMSASTLILAAHSLSGDGIVVCPTGTTSMRMRVSSPSYPVSMVQGVTTKIVGAAATEQVITFVGTGSWSYSVPEDAYVQIEFLSNAITHKATDWQASSDSLFATVVKQSLNDTINLTQWDPDINAAGTFYIRVRYQDLSGTWSAWSMARSVTLVKPIERQTSANTMAMTMWYSSWLTSYQTTDSVNNTSWNTLVSMSRSTTYPAYNQNTSRITSDSWTTSWGGNVSRSTSWQTMVANVYATSWITNSVWVTQVYQSDASQQLTRVDTMMDSHDTYWTGFTYYRTVVPVYAPVNTSVGKYTSVNTISGAWSYPLTSAVTSYYSSGSRNTSSSWATSWSTAYPSYSANTAWNSSRTTDTLTAITHQTSATTTFQTGVLTQVTTYWLTEVNA